MKEEIKMPKIKFIKLDNVTTEKDLLKHMDPAASYNYLVFLRCKYASDKKWEYLIEACSYCGFDDILWLNDWYEGQQYVEYLGITKIDYCPYCGERI